MGKNAINQMLVVTAGFMTFIYATPVNVEMIKTNTILLCTFFWSNNFYYTILF